MPFPTPKIKVALVDDHNLLRKGLLNLIQGFDDFEVVLEAGNGTELQKKIGNVLPELVLLDVNMPGMDGYQTAAWLKTDHPGIKVLALSMYDSEEAIIRMIKNGARGYILKDAEPAELRSAMLSVCEKGFYYSELVTGRLIYSLSKEDENAGGQRLPVLNDREMEFLRLACTEKTYKDIAGEMCLSLRTVDGYREALFEKLQVKNRVGLVIYAIRKGWVSV